MKIVYLPLDERPCNYHFACRIAEGSGVQVLKPAMQVLGDKKQPADFDGIKEFLLSNAPGADSYVLSLDMLLYGGIVPSRLHHLSEDALCRRLSVVEHIKEINPKAKIYAFALIMRCPKYSSSDEEPDYYENFTCIADKCKHSCCVGWEIDIDEETLRYYQTVGGAFGERLRAGIEIGEDCACFRLGEDERCPFLNESGLCDIILYLGEESLSQICTDHPRFCSFYSDRTEIGLGLCCEEAGRRLLSQKDKINLVVLRDDGEEDLASEEETAFFMKRGRLFEMAQDRRLSVFARMREILREFDVAFPRKSFGRT